MKVYETTAMYAAAALVAAGGKLVGTAQDDRGKTIFRLEDLDGTLTDFERRYWRGTLPDVQPRVYVDALMQVRDSLYQAQRG